MLRGYIGQPVATVQELIELLRQCDPAAKVYIEVGSVDEPRDVIIVDFAVMNDGAVCLCAPVEN